MYFCKCIINIVKLCMFINNVYKCIIIGQKNYVYVKNNYKYYIIC